jgi:hypothetical protein
MPLLAAFEPYQFAGEPTLAISDSREIRSEVHDSLAEPAVDGPKIHALSDPDCRPCGVSRAPLLIFLYRKRCRNAGNRRAGFCDISKRLAGLRHSCWIVNVATGELPDRPGDDGSVTCPELGTKHLSERAA